MNLAIFMATSADPTAVKIIQYVGIFAVAFGVGVLVRRWWNNR
ncbi:MULTISPECIES: hypothetical protein [Trueperella]|uniref:Uncharacterized protein n=1 Tax=Trueperella abortisuis TaxID=445930 RepID=A0ABT9PL57_9ACTO|nr:MULTISPECIES: hypothetical protein [Trueperella]MDP9833464.1 hypothetical protein [Trueperella abortisuis]MDY5403356.1 hypothetical protein [Trueperella sp.]